MLDDLTARPYIIRALYEWCIDKELTPHLLIQWTKNKDNHILGKYAVNNRVIINISPLAVKNLVIGDTAIDLTARFDDVAVDLSIPHEQIIAVYTKESEQYIAFPKPVAPTKVVTDESPPKKGKPNNGKSNTTAKGNTSKRKPPSPLSVV